MHDLTISKKPPPNLRCLLGLNLKFIPRRRFTTSDLSETHTRFKQQIYLQDYYLHNPIDPNNTDQTPYNPKLHVRTHWMPAVWKVSPTTAQRTDSFLLSLENLFKKKQCTPNLSTTQLHLLKKLRSKTDFIITKADKNLGPCILETETYIQYALNDHLNDRVTYKLLSKNAAELHMTNVRKQINKFIQTYKKRLSKTEIKFIRKHTKDCIDPFPKLYLLMKVHKTPLKTRPVVSCSGSLLHSLGVWLDTMLQPIATSLPSFIASSYDLKEALQEMPLLPANAQLFTADAISMYTNIDTASALNAISIFLRSSDDYKHLPIDIILTGLELLMKNNVFQFGDCFFYQQTGTAMGTPPACCYATIYYAVHEQYLFTKYSGNLFFYRRYIDDVIGVWVPSNPNLTFDNFTNDFTFHKLRWEVNAPSDSVVFLDMVLTIDEKRVTTQLYEKILNLYLYISPFSAHSPGVLSGLIIGNILRIYHLCSDSTTRKDFYVKFFLRLRARGYLPSQLLPLFNRGITLAHTKPMPSTRNKRRRHQRALQLQTMRAAEPTKDTAILNIPYHPKDPISWQIQRLFRSHFLQRNTSIAGFNRLTIAYSRPKNLGELLSCRRIDAFNCPPVSSKITTRDRWARFFQP